MGAYHLLQGKKLINIVKINTILECISQRTINANCTQVIRATWEIHSNTIFRNVTLDCQIGGLGSCILVLPGKSLTIERSRIRGHWNNLNPIQGNCIGVNNGMLNITKSDIYDCGMKSVNLHSFTYCFQRPIL